MPVCVREGGVTLIGVTGDNLTSPGAHVHKVSAHVFPVSRRCADIKVIGVEAGIAARALPADANVSVRSRHPL